jgi:hypothetical protein
MPHTPVGLSNAFPRQGIRRRTSSLSERKLDTLFMAGFFPKTGNPVMNSATFGAKVGPLSSEQRSLRQAASGVYE